MHTNIRTSIRCQIPDSFSFIEWYWMICEIRSKRLSCSSSVDPLHPHPESSREDQAGQVVHAVRWWWEAEADWRGSRRSDSPWCQTHQLCRGTTLTFNVFTLAVVQRWVTGHYIYIISVMLQKELWSDPRVFRMTFRQYLLWKDL